MRFAILTTVLIAAGFPLWFPLRIDPRLKQFAGGEADTLFHFLLCLLLTFTVTLAFRAIRRRKAAYGTPVLLAILVFSGSEALQNFLPHRQFEVSDLVANLAGISAGAALAFLAWQTLNRWQPLRTRFGLVASGDPARNLPGGG